MRDLFAAAPALAMSGQTGFTADGYRVDLALSELSGRVVARVTDRAGAVIGRRSRRLGEDALAAAEDLIAEARRGL